MSGKKICGRPLKQFLAEVEKFHGWKAPGILIGGFMVDWGLELLGGGALLSAIPIRIIHFAERKKKGPTAVCRDCGEAYPLSQGPQCLACQGRKYYAEPDPSPL